MYQNNYIHNDSNSFQYITPNSRMVPPPVNNVYLQNNDYWRQPARTSSLQRQDHYFERESVIDPQSTRETFIEPNMSKLKIDAHSELIRDVNSQTKQIKSNVQHVNIQVVNHGYIDLPQPSVAIIEDNSITANTTRKSPKPPLPPLVIPPTPTRSTHMTTPTRSSSIQNTYNLTPSSLTPGSSRSMNSPTPGGPFNISPSTPTNNNNNYLVLPQQANDEVVKKKAIHKRLTIMPETEAERFLHQGIKFHEAGKLEQATQLFKKASDMDLPIAMFLYGISLRHGWGCMKNEHLAFQYLQKSAEHAVEDLSNLSSKVNTSVAKSELIMAIYELGVSFRHGWGCKKNKETAFYYFKIAADLKDPDAQNDLGHCYYHGQGVKKDLYLAAKYYRLAEKQGHGIMGNSWIWKSKYDSPSHK